MKKVLLFASAVAMAAVASAQVAPKDYSNAAIDSLLNDSINKWYQVTSHKLIAVEGVEVVDSSLWRVKGYTGTDGLYTKSSNTKNQLEVVFDRSKKSGDNYQDFNLVWAGWGKAFGGSPASGLYPFPYKVANASPVTVTAVSGAEQDTLLGYAVNMHDAPKVTIKVSATMPTNIRIDLIDKNRRVANVLAPHHLIKSANRDTTLEFIWDETHVDANNKPDWKYEDSKTDDFNVNVTADGWAGAWWDVPSGRNVKPIGFVTNGRTGFPGAVVLDTKWIVGIAVTIEDGSITTDHAKGAATLDYGYSLTDKKTVTFKSIIVGDTENTTKLAFNPKTKQVEKQLTDEKVLGTETSSVLVGSNIGRVFNVNAPATLVSVLGGAAVAKSIDGVITTDAPAGFYFIVSEAGVAPVVVK